MLPRKKGLSEADVEVKMDVFVWMKVSESNKNNIFQIWQNRIGLEQSD